MSDVDFEDAYVLPDADNHPALYFQRLIELPEHAHFKEHEIAVEWLMKVDPRVKGGKSVLAAVHVPTVQGLLKDLFIQLLVRFFGRMPEFLIVIDRDFWEQADDVTREAIIFHECCHVKQETDKLGNPKFDKNGEAVFGLVGHDLEEFNAVVERYGSWQPDIVDFLQSAQK